MCGKWMGVTHVHNQTKSTAGAFFRLLWTKSMQGMSMGISMGISILVSYPTIVCKVLCLGISMWELYNDPKAGGHMILRPGQNRSRVYRVE